MQTWRLDGGHSTLVLASQGGIPEVIYWGKALHISEDLTTLTHASSLDVTGGMLDSVPPLSLCPQPIDLFPGQPGLVLRDIDGQAILPDFKLVGTETLGNSIAFECSDDDYDFDLILRLEIDCDAETGVLTLRTEVTCSEEIRTVWVAAPTLPLPYGVEKTIEFAGKWTGEFQRHENPMSQGARLRESNTGRSGHETFPALIVPADTGCMGFHYGWSGGHKMVSAQLSDGRRYVQFGNATNSSLIPNHAASSEKLYAVWGADENAMAAAFQAFARKSLCQPHHQSVPRPVHYNCWEAIYFDHDIEVLKDIASRAAALGAERFVLDDGWFGQRNDDTSSLGDWDIDRSKYPDGLTPLIDHVQSEGMRFGIWFEPEMVNKASALYAAHPDWVLGGDEQPLGRNQLTLNLDRDDVINYLFGKIDAVLDEYDIDYVKWDHNRVLPIKDDRQTRAFYRLIDALKGKHPNVDFESCASGGGRIDYGVLQYCSRVWLSDSNDALERWKMQLSAAAFLPNEVTGSHVGPRLCHTSGRVLPMQFRAWVAASRHMGFEMDPRELTEEEAEILKEVTTWYKMNRDWLQTGTALRLPQTDPATMGEIQIAEDGTRFVAMMAQMEVSDQVSPHRIRLAGLEPDQQYQISLRNPQDAAKVSRGFVALRAQPVTLSGRALMDHGVQVPNAFPATMWVLEGHIA
ncbi:MAG: alpha-galactosidase [Pseudomonadota bacterium]